MRVNVYAEEITMRVERQEKKISETGNRYNAIRFFLHSSEQLHKPSTTHADDDSSAVTFWGSKEQLRSLFEEALKLL